MLGRIIRGVALTSLTLAFLPAPVVGGGIPAKTVKELKAATVYIKAQFRNAGGPLPVTGSGFVLHVDGETAYIATNHHVVNPRVGELPDGNPRCVFLSGTIDEKTMEAVVVASDPIRDLAVLKVTGLKNAPRPIPLDPNIEVAETMQVYAVGFPFGKKLALDKANPAITITRGTVSSLRSDSKGQLVLVQIDAEINPGNSGGPVVDDKGNLVGVAVAKVVEARTVGFAVPVKPLEEMMQGKVARVNFDPIKIEKDQAQVSIEASLLDPLGKVKDVEIHYRRLTGKEELKDLPRADRDGHAPLMKNAARAGLKLDAGRGLGSFPLTRAGGDRVALAFQASFVNGTGKRITTAAHFASVVFPSAIFTDKLSAADPLDKVRGQAHKVFNYKMQAGKHYVVEMRGDPKKVDPWLMIRDRAGNLLAEDDDSGGLLNSLIVFSPAKDDDYQLVATVFKGGLLGPFSLRVREEQAQPVGPQGTKISSSLTEQDLPDPLMNAPAKAFQLLLKKGRPCTIEMKSRSFDPYVRVENMAGLNLKNEDLGGEGQSTLVFTPPADGIYRVVCTSYDYKTGQFDLAINEGPAPKQYDVGREGLKLVGNLTATDSLDVELGKLTKFRCKVYEMKLRAGQRYQFDLISAAFDATLRIEDPRGKELAFDDNSGGMSNARIVFSPTADGYYRIIATHFDGKLGSFDLNVRVVP